jgi:hypothetical protein
MMFKEVFEDDDFLQESSARILVNISGRVIDREGVSMSNYPINATTQSSMFP